MGSACVASSLLGFSYLGLTSSTPKYLDKLTKLILAYVPEKNLQGDKMWSLPEDSSSESDYTERNKKKEKDDDDTTITYDDGDDDDTKNTNIERVSNTSDNLKQQQKEKKE